MYSLSSPAQGIPGAAGTFGNTATKKRDVISTSQFNLN